MRYIRERLVLTALYVIISVVIVAFYVFIKYIDIQCSPIFTELLVLKVLTSLASL